MESAAEPTKPTCTLESAMELVEKMSSDDLKDEAKSLALKTLSGAINNKLKEVPVKPDGSYGGRRRVRRSRKARKAGRKSRRGSRRR